MEDLQSQVAGAIYAVRSEIRWKPGSAARHLLKRKLRGHLAPDATLGDYEHIISTVLDSRNAAVYVYRHGDVSYIAVTDSLQNQHWLVMFDMDGLMESAFVIERPERYLGKPAFELVGALSEVLMW